MKTQLTVVPIWEILLSGTWVGSGNLNEDNRDWAGFRIKGDFMGVKGYKAFDSGQSCRGFLFKEGHSLTLTIRFSRLFLTE